MHDLFRGQSVFFAALVGVLMLAGIGPDAYAQEAWTPVRVTYVAGQNVYLDAGRDQGLLPDDTLAVYRDGALVGRFVVVSSMADRSVVTFGEAPFAVTRGTVFQVRAPALPGEELPPPPAPEVEPDEPVAVAPTPEVEQAAPLVVPRRRRAAPQATGRVMLSLNTLQSTTSWAFAPSGTTKRTFVTPSMNLHLTIRDLPQSLRLRTRVRADYRYSTFRSIEPTLSVRAYELLLEKDFSQFSVQAGRFSNRYAPYGGYWDGALFHFGTRQAGFGTAVGFMPDRSNEGFSPDLPRYSGFAHVEVGDRAGLRYAANVSFNEIRPTNDLSTHRFAGLAQRLQWRSLSFRNDVQLDRNPESGHWVASRLQVRGTVSPSRGVSLHARYTIRQPYSIYRIQRVVSYRRDQAHAGASVRFGGASFGADVAFNVIEDDQMGRVSDGRTFSGYLQLPRTGLLDLGFSATASYWQAGDAGVGSSFFLNTGVTRSLGRAQARLQYQFYRTATLADPLLTHSVTMHAVVPLGSRIFTSSQIRLQRSATLRSMALYTSLWYTF